jgi:hypothetical protein
LPVARVVGSLGASDQLDLYRVPIDPSTTYLQIQLTAVAPSTELPGRVWMIDAAGHIVGNWLIPSHTQSIIVSMEAINESLGSSVVFGVSHGDGPPTDPSGSPFTYQITVLRQSAPVLPAFPFPPVVVTLPTPSALIVLVSAGDLSTTSTASSVSDVSLAAAPVASSLPTATGFEPSTLVIGPLPARSAGPSGDRLADGDPIPPLDRLDAAMVDLKLIDILPKRSVSAVLRSASDSLDPGQPEASPVLVALRGAGGFPLLAAAVSRNPRLPHVPPGDLLPPISTTGCDPEVLTASAAGASGCHSTTWPAGTMAGSKDSRRSSRRGSAAIGLNVAATLAFGLLLPDLVAALQGVDPRRTLPRVLRLRRKKAVDDPPRSE